MHRWHLAEPYNIHFVLIWKQKHVKTPFYLHRISHFCCHKCHSLALFWLPLSWYQPVQLLFTVYMCLALELLYILALSVNLSVCLHPFTNIRRSLWQALILPIMWPLHLKRTWQLDGRTKSTLKERIPGNEQFQYNASVSSICPTPSQVLEAVISLTQQYV